VALTITSIELEEQVNFPDQNDPNKRVNLNKWLADLSDGQTGIPMWLPLDKEPAPGDAVKIEQGKNGPKGKLVGSGGDSGSSGGGGGSKGGSSDASIEAQVALKEAVHYAEFMATKFDQKPNADSISDVTEKFGNAIRRAKGA
jgi:hypothetical protein